MKFKDLLNIEKAIETKNTELEAKKQELERLRQEAELLKLITDINSKKYSDEELIDINNMYMFIKKDVGRVHFANKESTDNGRNFHFKFVDVYTNECLRSFGICSFSDMKNGRDEFCFCKHIKEVFPETLVYLDGRIPKLLLQKLYYQANNIDEKVLKLGAMKD